MQVNPKTGLKEEVHSFYQVPLVHQRSVGSLKFNGQLQAVHRVPLHDGLSLDFYARLNRSDELIVTFPGAASAEKNIYPLFARIATFRQGTGPFMAFADPTIMMDKSRNMRLSWFLGGPGFDPTHAIVRAIRRAQGKTGAKHIVLVGGSGGGFAALRVASMIPGSLAYLHEGTTNMAKSIPTSVDRYFDTIWPDWNKDQLLQAFPERFDMVRHYTSSRPENTVYMVQSEDDSRFRTTQYNPFRHAMGVKSETGSTTDGRRKFVLYKGKIRGHGKVTANEFQHHFKNALEHWRTVR